MYDKTIIKLVDKPQTRRYLQSSYNKLKKKIITVEKQTQYAEEAHRRNWNGQ